MISVQELISDPDLVAPQPYTILRSTDTWALGGVQSVTTAISAIGPVQQASNKEIQMLPEADRVGSMRSFWCTQQIYVTRGTAQVPSTHGETPTGGGTSLSLSTPPPGGEVSLWKNGKLLSPFTDYALSGAAVTLSVAAQPGDVFYATWPITAATQAANSDILVYGTEQYRVLQVYHDFGCGYWKAVATRMNAA